MKQCQCPSQNNFKSEMIPSQCLNSTIRNQLFWIPYGIRRVHLLKSKYIPGHIDSHSPLDNQMCIVVKCGVMTHIMRCAQGTGIKQREGVNQESLSCGLYMRQILRMSQVESAFQRGRTVIIIKEKNNNSHNKSQIGSFFYSMPFTQQILFESLPTPRDQANS